MTKEQENSTIVSVSATSEHLISKEEHESIIADIQSEHISELDKLNIERSKVEAERDRLKQVFTQITPYMLNDIPSSFNIGGTEYTVEIADNSTEDHGLFDPAQCKITVYKNLMGVPNNPQRVIKAFYHELVHCIAEAFKLSDLYDNETEIDNIGRGIMMFLQTRTFAKPQNDSVSENTNVNKE